MGSTARPWTGLTGAGAVGLALGLGLAGGLFDVLTGPGLRAVFAVCFVAGCVAAALLVRRSQLPVAAVLPPLVYVVIAWVAGAVQGSANGSLLVRLGLDLFTTLVLDAPALLVATGASLAVVVARAVARRRAVVRVAAHL